MTTKTAQFTPGPWESVYMKLLERKRVLANVEHLTEIQRAGLKQVNKELEAHYALREAAPAMYEALREAQELIRSLVAEEMIHSTELQRVGNCQANMWEALTQAEGRQA